MVVDTTIAGITVGDAHPVRIMGAINLSRESFYKGSVTEQGNVVPVAEQMVAEGADFIDVGARSTWPLADKITKEEERKRLIPALEQLTGNVDVPISVDTQCADLAREALEMGARIINDVSGLTADPGMAEVVHEYGCPVVVMASDRVPGDVIGMDAVMQSLDRIIKKAEDTGIAPEQIIIDPAIGKWVPEKVPIYDFETIDQLERLKVFGKPVLAAISRKSLIGEVLDKPPADRLMGSIAATAIAVYKGAHIIRTHDVAGTVDAIRVAEAIKGRNITAGKPDHSIEALDNHFAKAMDNYSIEVLDITSAKDAPGYFNRIGATGTGGRVMKDKTVYRVLKINNVTTTEALIIKQEALSRGCDAALPRDAVSHETDCVDLILMGTELQLKRLAAKLECQARDLPVIAGLVRTALQRFNDTIYRYG
ncbi:MAG: dihydropteroate synthase [Candidatus Methanocomedens sp.]|nr:MAG: dihydropteroate synthase [ANME-2 cluster archaeon]